MKKIVRVIVPIGVAALATACTGSPSATTSTPPAKRQQVPVAAQPVAVASVEPQKLDVPASTVPAYDPKGRRDPFQPPASPEGADSMTISAAKLTGIVRGKTGPLVLVETSEGLGYILKQGDTLAGGRLVEIGRNSVVFSVVPRPGTNTNRVVLTLAGD